MNHLFAVSSGGRTAFHRAVEASMTAKELARFSEKLDPEVSNKSTNNTKGANRLSILGGKFARKLPANEQIVNEILELLLFYEQIPDRNLPCWILNKQDRSGWTVLHLCCALNKKQLFNTLLVCNTLSFGEMIFKINSKFSIYQTFTFLCSLSKRD